jgi:glycosyltransferase involved in cell wall biosynthesis
MMEPLRVILVMIEPPLPFGHATARWSFVLLKGLAERGHRVTAFTASSKLQEIEAAKALFPWPNYDLRCYAHPKRNGLQAKWETLRRPYSYMFGRFLRRDLGAELARGFDVLHLEGTWTGWLGNGKKASNVLLNCHSLYQIDESSGPPADLREKLQRSLRQRAERYLLRNCGTLLTITPRLQREVREIAPGTPVFHVPFAIDLNEYPFIAKERRPQRPVVSVIGSMNWHPSYSAAVRLLTRLWPAIKQQVPNARLQIVGWNARHQLRDYLELADVDIAENVADIRPYFEKSSVLVYAPDRATGIKVKVLEALAFGVPVVTNAEGIEGIPARDGVHMAISDDASGIIDRTVALLKDATAQERMRIAGRELLETHFSPEISLDGVERCYRDMMARRAGMAA